MDENKLELVDLLFSLEVVLSLGELFELQLRGYVFSEDCR
jgi:hypothetical protein